MADRWPCRALGSVGVRVLDCEHKTPPVATRGYPYIAIPNLVDGRIDFRNIRLISADDFREWTRRTRPQAGDLIVTRRARVGDSAVVPTGTQCAIGQNLIILRSNGKLVDQGYLRWAARSPLWHSEVDRLHNVGAVFDSLNVSEVPQIRIPLPPISEQQAIATVLGALDEKIVVNELIAKSCREVGHAHFRAAVGEADAKEVQLASITELISRGVTPRYSEDASELRVLNQKCIRDGRVSFAPSRRTIADRVAVTKVVRPHDILINSTGVGTLGRMARWTKTGPCTVDSHITIVRFDSAKIDPVCAGFGMLDAEGEIEALGEGSTGQTELSRSQLANFRLILPSQDRTVQLRPKLDALERRADSALEETLALAELRDALLPKLMSGEIRVKYAEESH